MQFCLQVTCASDESSSVSSCSAKRLYSINNDEKSFFANEVTNFQWSDFLPAFFESKSIVLNPIICQGSLCEETSASF